MGSGLQKLNGVSEWVLDVNAGGAVPVWREVTVLFRISRLERHVRWVLRRKNEGDGGIFDIEERPGFILIRDRRT